MSYLPDGCTSADIDRAYGEEECPVCGGGLEADHRSCDLTSACAATYIPLDDGATEEEDRHV